MCIRDSFHPDGEPFRFDWDWLAPSGLSTKDFVTPSSLCFGTAKTFGLGGKYGAVSLSLIHISEDWDYTLQGLARINRESIDAIRQAIRELEQAGYIQRSRERDEKGRLRGADYVIFELPQPVPASVSPTLENPTLENPTQENPTLENPMQLNKDI